MNFQFGIIERHLITWNCKKLFFDRKDYSQYYWSDILKNILFLPPFFKMDRIDVHDKTLEHKPHYSNSSMRVKNFAQAWNSVSTVEHGYTVLPHQKLKNADSTNILVTRIKTIYSTF